MQKRIKILVIFIAIAMIFSPLVTSFGQAGSGNVMKSDSNGIQNESATSQVANGRSFYSGSFNYLNPSAINESKLFMQESFDGAYYQGNLYVLGSSVNGFQVLVETNASLGNPRTIYSFYSYTSQTGGMITTSKGIFMSFSTPQGVPGLFLYNSSGIHNVTGILPGLGWSTAYSYNTSLNYLYFIKYTPTDNHTFLMQYNISQNTYYNYSSQIGKNSSIEAIYQFSDTVYFTGVTEYSISNNIGEYPYFGEIDVSKGTIDQLSSNSHPDFYEAVNPDNLAFSDNQLYLGGVNFTRNSNTAMYLISYNTLTNRISNITNGLPANSSVTQLFSYGNELMIATYNATNYFYINYVGFYLLYASNESVSNLSDLMPGFFDNLNAMVPGYDYLIGWNYQNITNEIVKFDLSDPLNPSVSYYADPVGDVYPQFWTSTTTETNYGFVTTGGNGLMLENDSKVFAPQKMEGLHGFLVGSAAIGNISYTVGQSFYPTDGVLLYSYNMSTKSLSNETYHFASSLYDSNATFLQDARFGNGILIIGIDNESTTDNPILYAYYPVNGTARNITYFLKSQFNGLSLFGADLVNTTQGDYVLTATSDGMLFGLVDSSGYNPINGIPGSYNMPSGDSYSGGFQGMVASGNTIYITGNNATNGKPILMSYNSTEGFVNLNRLVENFTFHVSAIAYGNGTVYISGYNDTATSNNPELIAVNVTSGYSQSLSSDVPNYVENINSISAVNNTIFIVGGNYGNVQMGLLQISTRPDLQIQFVSSGLPSGEEWSVSLNGTTQTSTGTTMTFYVTPGSYSYEVNPNPYFYSNVSSGTVIVSQSPTAIHLGWIRESYALDFKEIGLAPGSLWTVSVDGVSTSSVTDSIVLSEKNGTYRFSINPVRDYIIFPSSGNISIFGKNVNVSVYFFQSNANTGSLLVNDTNALVSNGIFWSGQVSTGSGIVLYSGGNGLLALNDKGKIVGTVENGNTGYYSYSLYTGTKFYAGGNWYVPTGGINIVAYYPSNGSISELDRYLPSKWTSEAYNSTLVAMAYGNSTLLMIRGSATNSNLPVQIGLLKSDNKFVNISSQFSPITYRASVIYGGGDFLLLATGAAYLYNVTSNTTLKVNGANPVYSGDVISANQMSAYVNGNFYFINGSYLAKLPVHGTSAKNILKIENPTFVANVSGNIFIGNGISQSNGAYTEIGYLTGSSINWTTSVNGQVTDMCSIGNEYVFSGTYMSTFTPLLSFYIKPVYLNLTEEGLAPGAQWGIFADNVTATTAGTNLQIIVPSGFDNIQVVPPNGYYPSTPSVNIPAIVSTYGYMNATINFVREPTYTVEFVTSGLPAGTVWNVSINSVIYSTSLPSTNISLQNGTYNFQVGAVTGYIPVPPSGNFNISGSNVGNPILINFTTAQTFSVRFSESGLKSAQEWGVDFNGLSEKSSTGTISFTSLGGTFSYSVDQVQGYQSSVSSGNLRVENNITVNISFFTSSYSIMFTELGLPLHSIWSVSIGSQLIEGNSSSLSVSVPNGSYQFQVSGPAGFISNVTSGLVQINGQSTSVSLAFSNTNSYEIVFIESGLPKQSVWNVTLGTTSYISNSSQIESYYPNGTYTYTITTFLSGYVASDSGGSILVSGSPETVYVNFSDQSNTNNAAMNAIKTNAELNSLSGSFILSETGINFGVNGINQWQITINSKTYNISGSSMQIAGLTAGLYKYSVSQIQDYAINPQTGYVDITASSSYLNITFQAVPTYDVVFTPSGIPYGTTVYLTVDSTVYKFTPTAQIPFLTLSLPVGSYRYSVSSSGVYSPTLISGNVLVSDSQMQVFISFLKSEQYPVQFVAHGLSVGSEMLVSIGANHYSTTSGRLELNLTPGIYSYEIEGNGMEKPVIGSGTFQLTSSGFEENVTYVQQNYLVIFKSLGISGNDWDISFSSYNTTVSGNEVQFQMPNGSYSYHITTSGKYSMIGASGTVIVSGRDVTIYPIFEKEYEIFFAETGLPADTVWYFNSTAGSYAINSSSILSTFDINGSYAYSISSSNKEWRALTNSGSMNVRGSNLVENFTFVKVVYRLSFTEKGLANNTTWLIEVNGIQYKVSNNSLSIYVTNGTYDYESGNVSGFTASNGNGTIVINGNSGNVILQFTAQKELKPYNDSLMIEILSIAAVAIVAVAVGTILLRRNRKK